jgi:hypothetical protein
MMIDIVRFIKACVRIYFDFFILMLIVAGVWFVVDVVFKCVLGH